MTRIIFSRTFEKQIEKVPGYVQKKVAAWIWAVQRNGLREVQKSPGLHDEPLKGDRHGQRSVRLNKGYRLIYWVLEKHVCIELIEVHKHDY